MKKVALGNIVSIIITIILTAIIGCVLKYFWLVPINAHSGAFWAYALVLLVLGCIISFIVGSVESIHGEESSFLVGKIFLIVTIIAIVVVIVMNISSSKMVHPQSYVNAIEVNDGNFEEDFSDISTQELITVDVKTAQKLGDRTLGTIKNSSWYEADGEYNLISIKGEEYRISSVNYGGVFKTFKASKEGIPGYILVNAKTQEAEFVKFEEAMVYSPSAYFSKDLSRHLRSQYPSYMFGTSFFEVDDDGLPYWITAVKTSTIGLFGGKLENSVVITNAITGESNEYKIDDVPEWVDHVHSVKYLMNVIGWHYELVEGYFNFSKTNMYYTSYKYKDSKESEDESKYTPFEGYNSVMSKDGEILFYTGITPANNAETIVGFVLTSPKTGKTTYYSIAGAEESSAQAAAEGLVQNLKYSASFPTIINVDGVETYFMTLKDAAGLVQKYSLCNVENYSKVVEADSIDEAIQKYRVKLGIETEESSEKTEENIEEKEPETAVETKEASGNVLEVKEAQIDGYTYYYFTLDTDPDYTFMSSIENSNMQPLKLIAGKTVKVTFYDSKEENIGIVTKISF